MLNKIAHRTVMVEKDGEVDISDIVAELSKNYYIRSLSFFPGDTFNSLNDKGEVIPQHNVNVYFYLEKF